MRSPYQHKLQVIIAVAYVLKDKATSLSDRVCDRLSEKYITKDMVDHYILIKGSSEMTLKIYMHCIRHDGDLSIRLMEQSLA